ncbi:patatin-like phospholipase family protein [Rhodococcus sp. UNC363MFTsu5.1]|uniref:patatin-like phospholipase family protein n=1 Tax=Rhodococcus sp. UNC363MFTsu5.1 TaxID=1449069 RepID=UPI000487723E|nr:patatin-like phospholipase family protein [Rhodococcus sp. UNC363MFTsu5.1]
MADERALVLGGGGVAGIAWETGIVAGLAEAGLDVTNADLLVGTSAGANVAAQIGSGLSIGELFQRQVDPALQSHEIVPPGNPIPLLLETWNAIAEEAEGDQAEITRRLAAAALRADTIPEPDRRAVIESRLPVHDWPDRELLVLAVDGATGEPRVFHRDSGVSLVDAVTASSAVPLIWPAVTIEGVRYVDGGVRTSTNSDYATGANRILVIAANPDVHLDAEVAALTADGALVEVIRPDEPSLTAFGANPLDTATRLPAAECGRGQGKSEAARIAALWS